jgi:Cu/Ag efflux pump CusA
MICVQVLPHITAKTVLGIAMMMMGENSRTVAQAVDSKIKEIH